METICVNSKNLGVRDDGGPIHENIYVRRKRRFAC